MRPHCRGRGRDRPDYVGSEAIASAGLGFFAEARFHAVFTSGDNLNLLPINAGVRIRF